MHSKVICTLSIFLLATFASACAKGGRGAPEGYVELAQEEPTAIEDVEDAEAGLLFWFTNETYYDPEQLVGVVFGFGKKDQPGEDDPIIQFPPEKLGRILGWELTKPSQPRMRYSLLATKQLAGEIDALTYLEAAFKSNQVASLVISDLKAIRAVDDIANYIDSLSAWLESNIAMVDRYQKVVVVDGAVLRNVTGRFYTKLESRAKGGAFGVNVNGSYYTSNEKYFADYVFGLDFRDLTELIEASGEVSMTPRLMSTTLDIEDFRIARENLESMSEESQETLRELLFSAE